MNITTSGITESDVELIKTTDDVRRIAARVESFFSQIQRHGAAPSLFERGPAPLSQILFGASSASYPIIAVHQANYCSNRYTKLGWGDALCDTSLEWSGRGGSHETQNI
jgi:hypothetical protein